MRFRRRLTPTATVDLIPMIDVVFQLVVFFMVSSTFITTPGISLALPESSTAENVVMTKLVITMANENEIYINKERYNLEDFETALAGISAEMREDIKTVVLEGDRTVNYALMVQVLDILRENNFRGVNLKMRESNSTE